MYLAVKKVKAIEDYKLLVTFENNENRIFDMSPYLTIGKFAELKDKSLFRRNRGQTSLFLRALKQTKTMGSGLELSHTDKQYQHPGY